MNEQEGLTVLGPTVVQTRLPQAGFTVCGKSPVAQPSGC